MSSSISPIFKFNFEQTGGSLTDLTGNGYKATAETASALIPVADDPMMGRCLQFTGNTGGYLTVSNSKGTLLSGLPNGFTLTCWVYMEVIPLGKEPCIINFGDSIHNMSIQVGSGTPYYFHNDVPPLDSTENITEKTWTHIALSMHSSGKAKFYINGNEHGKTTNTALAAPASFTSPQIVIGSGYGGNTGADVPLFNGMMAWMALYDGHLGSTEILGDMAEGQTKRASSFRQSMPIDFKLYSDDGGAENPILFIEDEGAGEDLNLRIFNNSLKSITYQTNSGPVSSTNYHFQLRFRPGVLSKNFLNNYSQDSNAQKKPGLPKLLANNPNWTAVVNGGNDSIDTISFLHNGGSNNSLEKGEDHLIVVSAVNASATGGSRNTNVELRYDNLLLGAATSSVHGYRKQNISIVNHSGEKEIPLRAEIVGNASVMTYAKPADGSTVNNPPISELSFQIINTGLNPLPLALPGSTDGATTFTLSIDVQPKNHLVEWALIDQGAVSKIGLSLNKLGTVSTIAEKSLTMESPLIESLPAGTALEGGPAGLIVASPGALAGDYKIPVTTSPSDGFVGAEIELSSNNSAWKTAAVSAADAPPNTLQWTIINQSVQEIPRGGGVSFLLKGIECSLPAGSSVVTLGYANVPGHWQGAFELTVEKSPMAYKQNLIGINTQEPNGSLHIEEENDYPPLVIGKRRVGIPQAPLSWVLPEYNNWPWEDFLPLSTPNKYYNPKTYINSTGNVCFDLYTLQNGDFTSESIVLSEEGTVSNPGTSEGSGVVLFYYGYLYVLSYYTGLNQAGLNTYDFSSETTATFLNTFNANEGGNTYYHQGLFICNGQLFTLARDQAHGGDSFGLYSYYMLQWQGMTTDGSAPSLSYKATIYFHANNPISLGKVSGDMVYVSIYGGPKELFEIYQVGSDGTPQKVVSINDPGQDIFYGVKYIYNDYVYYVDGSALNLSAFNLAQASPSTPVYSSSGPQLSAPYTREVVPHIFYKNYLFISNNVGSIYQLDEPDGPKLIKTITWFNASEIQSFGSSTVIIPNLPKGGTSVKANVFDTSDLFDILFGKYTYVTSDSISIGTKLPMENTPLAVNDSNGDLAFVVDKNGYVGIGTDTPKAPLHVKNFGSTNQTTYAYLTIPNLPHFIGNTTAAGSTASGNNDFQISIVSEYAVLAKFFIANSDVRIKESISPSYNSRDLSTVLNIEIKDFSYIDFIGNGTIRKKGLIAQQVKKVFPQAVSDQNTDFIPDIYAMATDLKWQHSTQHLQISLEHAHDLKAGDKVRLIAEQGFEEKEVVAVPDNKSFVVSEWDKPVDKLFVFGKEVHDFHTVDYDQVAMLGVSAIQALHQKLEARDQKTEALEKRVAALERENSRLKLEQEEELSKIRQEMREFKTALSQQHMN